MRPFTMEERVWWKNARLVGQNSMYSTLRGLMATDVERQHNAITSTYSNTAKAQNCSGAGREGGSLLHPSLDPSKNIFHKDCYFSGMIPPYSAYGKFPFVIDSFLVQTQLIIINCASAGL